MATERLIDAREMEPPEPLEVALDILGTLRGGEYLRMLHRREPFPLYQMLERDGFCHLACPGAEIPYEIFIWRCDDCDAANSVQEQAGRIK